jgi:hypothetical protein
MACFSRGAFPGRVRRPLACTYEARGCVLAACSYGCAYCVRACVLRWQAPLSYVCTACARRAWASYAGKPWPDVEVDHASVITNYLDASVGKFVATLAAEGLTNDTLVIFASDNVRAARGRAGGRAGPGCEGGRPRPATRGCLAAASAPMPPFPSHPRLCAGAPLSYPCVPPSPAATRTRARSRWCRRRSRAQPHPVPVPSRTPKPCVGLGRDGHARARVPDPTTRTRVRSHGCWHAHVCTPARPRVVLCSLQGPHNEGGHNVTFFQSSGTFLRAPTLAARGAPAPWPSGWARVRP